MRRRAVALLPLLLLAPLASSCAAEASAAEVVAGTAAATVDTSTAKMTMTLHMSDLPGARDLTMEGKGETDLSTGRTLMEMDMGALLAVSGAAEEIDATMETLADGRTIYMRGAMFTGALGLPEGTWLRADLDELGKAQGLDMRQMQASGTNDPRQTLALLNGVSEDGVEEIGEEKVRGVDTTHYRAQIDLERAIEEADGVADRKAFEQFVETLGSDTVEVDVWIDGDNLLRRLKMDMPLPEEAGDAGSSVTMELFDFGTAVDVSPPPADQTQDFLEVAAAGGG